MTDALVSALKFSKGRGDAEVAWIDAIMTARDNVCPDAVVDTNPDEAEPDEKILTLEPMQLDEVRKILQRHSCRINQGNELFLYSLSYFHFYTVYIVTGTCTPNDLHKRIETFRF